MLLDFGFDLFGSIGHKNAGVRLRSRHFGVESLERGEELSVETCRFRGFELGADITSHSEVGVLVDSSRDQTRDVLLLTEDVRESVREGGDSLHSWECEFTNTHGLIKAKYSFKLIEVNVLLNADHIRIQVLNVLAVREDESLFRVKAESYNIFYVVNTHLDSSTVAFKLEFRLKNELFIVSNLDHKRDIKDVLEVLCEDEGDSVTHVEGIS